ncbi:MAG: hypothetical protein ACM3ZA_00985 [Bacillota bacterium]
MSVAEHIPWHGRIRVTTRYRSGRVDVEEFDNLITDAGRNLLRDALDGTVSDCAIKYMAWGDGNVAPAAGDVALGNELGRKAVTKQQVGGAGQLTTTVYLAPFEANGQIQELGWFAGAGATAAVGSGVLVARVLYAKLKTDLESIQIDRVDTIG